MYIQGGYMEKISIYLTKRQIEFFNKHEARIRSELIRRAIDNFIREEEKNEK